MYLAYPKYTRYVPKLAFYGCADTVVYIVSKSYIYALLIHVIIYVCVGLKCVQFLTCTYKCKTNKYTARPKSSSEMSVPVFRQVRGADHESEIHFRPESCKLFLLYIYKLKKIEIPMKLSEMF